MGAGRLPQATAPLESNLWMMPIPGSGRCGL